MSENSLNENDLERAGVFGRRMVEAAQGIVERYTVPIFGFQHGTIRQDRTGVLLQIDTHRFLLTAAHKLKDIIENKIFLGVPRLHDGEPVRLENCRALLSDKNVEDIAVFKLDDTVADEIAMRNDYLRVYQLEQNGPPKYPFYCIHGFPVAWKSFNDEKELHTYESLTFGTTLYENDLEPEDRQKTDTFIRLIYGPTIDCYPDGETSVPKAFGLSGCGIWQLCALRQDADLNWTTDDIRLAGIQHRQYTQSKKYIKGTLINIAVRMIWDQFPELRGAISLSL